jgi:hypothetical protein
MNYSGSLYFQSLYGSSKEMSPSETIQGFHVESHLPIHQQTHGRGNIMSLSVLKSLWETIARVPRNYSFLIPGSLDSCNIFIDSGTLFNSFKVRRIAVFIISWRSVHATRNMENEVGQTSKGFPWSREASVPVYYTDDAVVVVDYGVLSLRPPCWRKKVSDAK